MLIQHPVITDFAFASCSGKYKVQAEESSILLDINIVEPEALTGIKIYSLKVLVPIHSLIPPIFFKHMEILIPKVESYLEGCMYEVSCANSQ